MERSQLSGNILGSPPPMRGKAKHWQATQMHRRITPAYAGKSRYFSGGRRDRRDHPRLCGEKFFCPFTSETGRGSPPPMRGKAQNRINRIIDFGITPAYAGKSEQSGLQCFISGDHPRLCGEKKWRERRMKLDKGSPPPMRGKG